MKKEVLSLFSNNIYKDFLYDILFVILGILTGQVLSVL